MEQSLHTQALAEIRRDIADLESQLELLRAVERYHAAKAGVLPTAPVGNGQHDNGKPAEAGEFAGMTMRDAAVIILRRAGRKVPTGWIAKELLAGGYQSKNPDGARNALYAMMKRETGLFLNTGDGVWQLCESVSNS